MRRRGDLPFDVGLDLLRTRRETSGRDIEDRLFPERGPGVASGPVPGQVREYPDSYRGSCRPRLGALGRENAAWSSIVRKLGGCHADAVCMRRHVKLSIFTLCLLSACHGGSVNVESAAADGPSAPDPRVVAAAWSHALLQGPLPASLEWVRPESRALLVRHPEVIERVRNRVAALGEVSLLEVVVRGERAALFAPKTPAVEPILLLLVDGEWRVDVVEVEKSYAQAASGRLDAPANTRNPYRRLAPPSARAMKSDLGEIDLYAEPIEDVIARLGRADDPASKLRLAEILLRNCWLVDEAVDQFEAAIRMQGQRVSMDRFADFASNAGVPDRAIPIAVEFEVMSERVLAGLHQRAKRYDKSQIYIERIMSRAMGPQSGVAVGLPASPGAPAEP